MSHETSENREDGALGVGLNGLVEHEESGRTRNHSIALTASQKERIEYITMKSNCRD